MAYSDAGANIDLTNKVDDFVKSYEASLKPFTEEEFLKMLRK